MAFVRTDTGVGTPILPSLDVQVDVTNPPTNSTFTWTSIVSDVRSVTFTRSGRNDEFQRTSPGTCTLVLDNNQDGVTSLGLKKAQWVRVQAQWSATTVTLWQGVVTSAPRQWPQAGYDATLTVQAADALYLLRLYDMVTWTFPSERCDQRIGRMVSLAGAAGVSGTVNLVGTFDSQTDTLDAMVTPLGLGSDALSQSLAIEGSDNGLLIARPDGVIDYQGRHWRFLNSQTSVLTLDEASGVNYQDSVTYEDDDSRLANIVAVTPFGSSTPQFASDAASQATYWQRRNPSVDRQLLSSNTTLATSAAQYLLARYRDPPPRIPVVSVDLTHGGSNMLTLLNLANSQRVTWTRQATTPITVDGYVEQIQHTIQPGTNWTVSLQVSPTLVEKQWVLGDSVNGQLGITTALAY